MPVENDIIKAKGGVVLGTAESSPAELAAGKLKESQFPNLLINTSQIWVSVKEHGAVGNGSTDDTAAIKTAQEYAIAASPNAVLWFPAGTYVYSSTIKCSLPWEGYPRKSILKQSVSFTYEGFAKQFGIINEHFADKYNSETADTVKIKGIDFIVVGNSIEAGKGSIGFANIAGGSIRDCRFTTEGANTTGAPLDLYACVKKFELNQVHCINSTKAISGGGAWIRNLTSEPENSSCVTEQITVTASYFATTTGDEALAVFGGFGLVRKVKITAILEGLESTQNHQVLADTFPITSPSGEHLNAAVEDVLWTGCTFIDVNNTNIGTILRFGVASGSSYVCQNVRVVDSAVYAKTSQESNTQSIIKNEVNKFEGPYSGNKAVNVYVNAESSTKEFLSGFTNFSNVTNCTIYGKVNIAFNNCLVIRDGEAEAIGKGVLNCPDTLGTKFKLITSAAACVVENANSTFVSFKKCVVVGGKTLIKATSGATSAVHIDVKGNIMNTTATSGNVVETPTSSAPRVILLGNTVYGSNELTRSGTIALSSNNDWFGKPDHNTVLESGRSAEMVAGKITIAAPAVTATGVIDITTEGGTAIGASIVERTAGTGFKVEATVTSIDRINWAVYSE